MLKRKMLILIYTIAFLYILFGLLLFIFQNKLIYPADKTDFNTCAAFSNSEKISDVGFRGYLLRRSDEKIVIYYHGNGGRSCDRYYMDSYFEKAGVTALFVEYPGYAESGTTSMSKILDEVRLVNDFIKNQSFKEVIVIGESIGTGPASYHAYMEGNNVTKLILITPYNNMASVVSYHYPFYPVKILLRNNFVPDEWLRNVSIPVSLIVAENDEVVGAQQGIKLSESIKETSRHLDIIKGAGHNSIYSVEEFSKIFYESLTK